MPTRVIRRLRGAQPTDSGVTLVELLVGMALSTLLGAMTLTLFIDINSSSAATTDRTINTASVRNAIQSWTSYLRVADGTTPGDASNRIEWLTASDMLFYADINNRSTSGSHLATTGAPTMVWLRLDGSGNLVEEQFPSTAAKGSASTTCRILASNVSTPSSPLFRAYDRTGNSMAGRNLGTAPVADTGCQPLPVTVPSRAGNADAVAAADLLNVRSVVIDAVVRDSSNEHPIEFTSQAVLPNVGGAS